MSNKPQAGRPNIFPALKYQDAPRAIEFLVKAFGFEKQVVYDGEPGKVAHAQMKIGPGVVMLGSDQKNPANPWDAVRMGIYVYVEDIDAHYAQAKAAGAQIVRPLADTDYGSREYSVHDCEKNLWSFGTYYPEDPS